MFSKPQKPKAPQRRRRPTIERPDDDAIQPVLDFAIESYVDTTTDLTLDLHALEDQTQPGYQESHNSFELEQSQPTSSQLATISMPTLSELVQTSVASPLNSNQSRYYQHFLFTVSTYLIIWDTPSNSNPYRMLPSLVSSSGLLQNTMEALGAMHLSSLPQTQDRQVHRNEAINIYTNVVTDLREALSSQRAQPDLELLATCLLLCMFENMSATDASWKVHLLGAGQTLQRMYSPRTGLPYGCGSGGQVAEDMPSLRRFLVSLMSYLDIAASCATGEDPIIPGDYWETLGGGWEYNLGVPTFATVRRPVDRAMAQIRSSWSRIMSIQTDISKFAKAQRSGLEKRQREMIQGDLAYRIRNWHDSAPDVFLQLEYLDSIPSEATDEETEALTAAACVYCYALGCAVYLDRVANRRVGSAAFDMEIKATVDRMMTLIVNFSSGVNQLAMLWPLLTAGIATVDTHQQDLCRSWLGNMTGFGFKVCLLRNLVQFF